MDWNLWIAHYGGVALFCLLIFGIVGLPIPDETLLVLCGYLIHKHRLNAVGTWLGGALGSIAGITFSYIIGRTIGFSFLHSKWARRMHVTEHHIAKVHNWFERVGRWALFIGYYIPGVRHFTAIVAGTSDLDYRSFALFAYSGACVWVTTFMAIGYWASDHADRILEMVEHNIVIAAMVLGAAIVIYAAIRIYKRRSRMRARM